MKDKILMLIIGALIGAIITAGCFLIFGNKTQSNMPNDFGGKGQMMGNFTGENGMQRGNRGNENSIPSEQPGAKTSDSTSNS